MRGTQQHRARLQPPPLTSPAGQQSRGSPSEPQRTPRPQSAPPAAAPSLPLPQGEPGSTGRSPLPCPRAEGAHKPNAPPAAPLPSQPLPGEPLPCRERWRPGGGLSTAGLGAWRLSGAPLPALGAAAAPPPLAGAPPSSRRAIQTAASAPSGRSARLPEVVFFFPSVPQKQIRSQ